MAAVVVGAGSVDEPGVLLERDDLVVSSAPTDSGVRATVARGSGSWDFVADGSTLFSDDTVTVAVSTYGPLAVAQAAFSEPPANGVTAYTGECFDGARAIGFQIPDLVRLDLIYASDGLDVRARHATDFAVVISSEGGFYARDVDAQGPLAEHGLEAFSHEFVCELHHAHDGSVTYVDLLLSSVRISGRGVIRFLARGGVR